MGPEELESLISDLNTLEHITQGIVLEALITYNGYEVQIVRDDASGRLRMEV